MNIFGLHVHHRDWKADMESACAIAAESQGMAQTYFDEWQKEKTTRQNLGESFLDAADLRKQIAGLQTIISVKDEEITVLGVETSVLNSKLLAEQRSNNSLRGTITRMKGKKA